jgi:carboxyl-terminal processing protease
MKMIRHSRLHSLLVLVAVAVLPAMAAPAGPGADDPSLRNWSNQVWRSVLEADQTEFPSLEKMLDMAPLGDGADQFSTRFRDTLQRHRANREVTRSKRLESKEEAAAEMREYLVADDLSQALRSAVEVQTLSDNLDQALLDEDVRKIIRLAERRIPEVEQKRDWLLAQELLFRLRTLYEDTGAGEEFSRIDHELELVNRRVGLLALYAPERLHELRNQAAIRAGEEPLDEFNAALTVDWRERVEEVDHRMLRAALHTAAREHIEQHGWRPLLEGGLQSLEVFASTETLADEFPNLGDQARVRMWLNHIRDEQARLARLDDSQLDRFELSAILGGLLEMNERSVQLDEGILFREFGDGAMNDLDKFSEIIWPDKLRRFMQATEGNFVGVGILIRNNERREIMVVHPLEGAPAYFAGVKPNDIIVEVDGESTVGWSLNDAVDRITGRPNTAVTLGLRRDGVEDPIQVTITRDVIKLRSVRGWWKERLDENGEPVWNWFIDPVSRIAYIRLTQFTEDSYDDLVQAWEEASRDGRPNGLILDLRFNPGGLLTSAVQISNLFVQRGMIVSGEDKDGRVAWGRRANPVDARISDVPVIVLINQGSASASEIVAGCLQAHNAAVIVGERTYGKGSVQTVHHVARNARLKLTTQYYRLPPPTGRIGEKGRLVHKRPGEPEWGVDPDMVVKMTPWQVTESLEFRRLADLIPEGEDGALDPDSPERPRIEDLLVDGLDPQLDTALLILQATALGHQPEDMKHASIK